MKTVDWSESDLEPGLWVVKQQDIYKPSRKEFVVVEVFESPYG